ncbi:hypothetical protein [Palleronia caenipelagi]|uniref:Uncharacterized protein n=1 Tax=Palleronia caenipelagi TaxID=2489174 RepID=A0A547QAW9_9RHOB|nr:hypothetical protein [Palleronia caenipelagi]TRD23486.1 hypothetical protein FEV53_00270 [Palleronia caenipelagi]
MRRALTQVNHSICQRKNTYQFSLATTLAVSATVAAPIIVIVIVIVTVITSAVIIVIVLVITSAIVIIIVAVITSAVVVIIVIVAIIGAAQPASASTGVIRDSATVLTRLFSGALAVASALTTSVLIIVVIIIVIGRHGPDLVRGDDAISVAIVFFESPTGATVSEFADEFLQAEDAVPIEVQCAEALRGNGACEGCHGNGCGGGSEERTGHVLSPI